MNSLRQKTQDIRQKKKPENKKFHNKLVSNVSCLLSSNKGLTIVELLVVIGILSVLLSIGIVSILNIRVITSNNTSTAVIASDLKTQQIKAMTGDTEGRGVPDNYGIKILSNQYVLFHGNTYSPSDTSNFPVPVDTGYTLSTTFPNDTILFASQSGEISGFVQNNNTIKITNTVSSQSKTIQLNKYGTITNIN